MLPNMASLRTGLCRQSQTLLLIGVINEMNVSSRGLKAYLMSSRRALCHLRHQKHVQKRSSLCVGKVSGLVSPAQQRCMSTSVEVDETKPTVDPFSIVEREIASLEQYVKKELRTENQGLTEIAEYYFDGKGKAFRPMLVMLMAKALNFHISKDDSLLESQRKIAMIAEMIHTSSLMHDDVIDHADTRRGKRSINLTYGQRKSILAGDYVMSQASIALSRIRNNDVVSIVSQITEDLVKGEFMQLGSKENDEERFNHYLMKTFKKTASLLANSCQAVAILGGCDDEMSDMAYQYGKNIGISFQLVDDLLDFTSCDDVMGKPTAADLRLGLATAPVLYAARKYPELNAAIMRRFSQEGDVERARELVAKSDGVAQTRLLAKQHSEEAVRLLQSVNQSKSLQALEHIAAILLTRIK